MADQVKSPCLRGSQKGYTGDFCCVPDCSNRRGKAKRLGKQISFYQFPKCEKRKELWLKHIRRNVQIQVPQTPVDEQTPQMKTSEVPFKPTKWSRVCSEHFVGGKKVDIADNLSYVPTVFARNISSTKRSTQRSQKAGTFSGDTTTKLSSKRKRATSGKSTAGRPKRKLQFDDSENAVWNTTDHDYIKTRCDIDDMPSSQDIEIEDLKAKNSDLQSKFLRLENVKNDDDNIQFWTNLPNYSVFSALVTYLKTRCNDGNLCYWRGSSTNASGSTSTKGPSRKFTFEEELFIVLVKLKTGNFNEDLSHTFDTSVGHISTIFSTWINFLNNELKALFEMQSSESDMAECYRMKILRLF